MATPQKKKISVIERRLKSGSAFAVGSRDIPLVNPKRWTLRVVNSQVRDGHLYAMIGEKGWDYAAAEDLAVDPIEVGFHVQDGRIVRGDKGQEVLLKMERSDYQQVVAMKDQQNKENTFSSKAVKQTMVSAVGGEFGDQGANFINNAIKSVEISDARGTEG